MNESVNSIIVMKFDSRCSIAIKTAVAGIDAEISQRRQGVVAVITVAQLEEFKAYLIGALNSVLSGDVPGREYRELGMSKIIVDQWPLDYELGSLIIEAEQAYKSM